MKLDSSSARLRATIRASGTLSGLSPPKACPQRGHLRAASLPLNEGLC